MIRIIALTTTMIINIINNGTSNNSNSIPKSHSNDSAPNCRSRCVRPPRAADTGGSHFAGWCFTCYACNMLYDMIWPISLSYRSYRPFSGSLGLYGSTSLLLLRRRRRLLLPLITNITVSVLISRIDPIVQVNGKPFIVSVMLPFREARSRMLAKEPLHHHGCELEKVCPL